MSTPEQKELRDALIKLCQSQGYLTGDTYDYLTAVVRSMAFAPDTEPEPVKQYILVTGGPNEGFTFHGPLPDDEERLRYEASGFSLSWFAQLLPLPREPR